MHFFSNIIDKILHIGIDKNDSESLRLDKISINMLPLIIVPSSFLWSFLHIFLGSYLLALVPLFYIFASIGTLIHFHKTKDIRFIKHIQMLLILILPFLLMWTLGGFAQSSYVFIWAFFAPVTALIHDKSEKYPYWIYSFIGLIILSAIIDPYLIEHTIFKQSLFIVEIFYILNISLALSGIYFLIRYFISETDRHAYEKLDEKHTALVHNTKELKNSISFLKSYKSSIDNNLIVTRTDIEGNITYANQNFYNITGYTKKEVIGQKHSIVKSDNTPVDLFQKLWQTILNKKTWHGTLENRKKDGSSYWVDTTISPILDNENKIVEFIAIRHNITKLIEHQSELTKMLYIDPLTNLPNRNALIKDLENNSKLSATLINIDKFSHINNLYGEEFGNKVLKAFSNFLYQRIQDDIESKLYRLGGDEFIILSTYTDVNYIEYSAKMLLVDNESSTITVEEQSISLNITLGISVEENSQLLTTVNMALISARKKSKNLKVYTDALSLSAEYENNLKWIKEIKEAIDDNRITLFFQAIVDNSDNTIRKYETLIRLIDKNGNIITPNYFLNIAKKAKLYKQLTKIVLYKSFEAFKNNNYEFSVNITVEDILDKEINNYIINILEKYDISQRVIFEIVESENIENFDDIEKFILTLKSYGCRIAIDDFGTGYSNFEHLMRLQVDYIKIDGSIIKEITTDKRSALITSMIVAFAKEINIQTIGEFVENKEINDMLISLGVNKSQGYYFSKPQATLVNN